MKQGKPLLIIYREPGVISLLTDALSELGFQVISSSNYEDIFPTVEKHDIHIAILDDEILSTHQNLVNDFLRINPDVQIIVIISQPRSLNNEYDEKVCDYIYMPFSHDDLKRTVNNASQKLKLIEERNVLVQRIKEKNIDFEFPNPIIFYSCFISYSSKDEIFAQKIKQDLDKEGVKCWFAPDDLKIGDKFRATIDESIRIHDKLLLILSTHSLHSNWVEKEVETAFEREQKEQRIVLFPIRLDDSIMTIQNGWPADIRRTRHIGDFRKWRDRSFYRIALKRLLSDLKQDSKTKE